jgi:hypothetical protein
MKKPKKKKISRREQRELTSCDAITRDEAGRELEMKRFRRLQNYGGALRAANKGFSEELLKKDKVVSGKGIFKVTKLGLLADKRAEAKAKAFIKETERLRKKVKTERAQRLAAKDKLKRLKALERKIIRLDSLARMKTELGKNDPFAGHESASAKRDVFNAEGKNWAKGSARKYAPAYLTEDFYRSTAHQISQWGGLAKYQAVAYFDKGSADRAYEGHAWYDWHMLKDKPKILAVQVMHWDPKKLMDLTKAMLKRRPKDPVAILDIYGRPFFP